MIPDEKEALSLHEKYGSHDRLVRHCQTVTKVALVLTNALRAKGVPVDERAVAAAALLHDIGRNRTHTVHHGYEGAELLRGEGVDATVLGIVMRHVGAGISSDEARLLGFPEGDYVPTTIEEKIVCFSDKMVSSDSVRPLEEEAIRFERRGHDVRRLVQLKEDIARSLGEDPEAVILSKLNNASQEKSDAVSDSFRTAQGRTPRRKCGPESSRPLQRQFWHLQRSFLTVTLQILGKMSIRRIAWLLSPAVERKRIRKNNKPQIICLETARWGSQVIPAGS